MTRMLWTVIVVGIAMFPLAESAGKVAPPGSGAAEVPANVLILLDTSGSMRGNITTRSCCDACRVGDANCLSRMEQAKEAFRALLQNTALTTGVKYGLMTWDSTAIDPEDRSSDHPGNVPVEDTGAATIVQHLTSGNSREPCPNRFGRKNFCSGGTNLENALRVADLYFSGSNSPIDPDTKECQINALIVISDGVWFNHTGALRRIEGLVNKGIRTIMVGFSLGPGTNRSNYRQAADAGDDGVQNLSATPVFADTPGQLELKLGAAVRQIIASKFSFALPALSSSVSGDNFALQSTFTATENHQWQGSLLKFKLNALTGEIDTPDLPEWDAGKRLAARVPTSREILTVVPGRGQIDFSVANRDDLVPLLWSTESPEGSSNAETTALENSLIQFVLGTDVYDEDGNDNTTEDRPSKLADIYHSQPVVVGSPSALTRAGPSFTESAYRDQNNYAAFKQQQSAREEIILAGSNGGILHAFQSNDGRELWGFIPPSLLPKLHTMTNCDIAGCDIGGAGVEGKTNAIYGVDGTVVVKDIDINGQWRTIALVGLRQGGHSYFALDITNPANPKHLFTIDNNTRAKIISYWQGNANTVYQRFSYGTGTTIEMTINTVSTSSPNTFQEDDLVQGNTSGAEGFVQFWNSGTGNLVVRLKDTSPAFTSGETVTAIRSAVTLGTLGTITGQILTVGPPPPELDFRELGEAWSRPLILNIELTNGARKWVAVFGGGQNGSGAVESGSGRSSYGSVLYVIDLETGLTGNGKILQAIPLTDDQPSRANPTDDIVNAVPASVVGVTADTTTLATYAGALIYVVDLEGKLWKLNLSRQKDTLGNTVPGQAPLFSVRTLFDAEATQSNARLNFYDVGLAIGSEKKLWIYFGTGNIDNLQQLASTLQNRVHGIRDQTFPNFSATQSSITASSCSDVTPPTSINCPPISDNGWFYDLGSQKVTGPPIVFDQTVYVSYYLPQLNNRCNPGKGTLLALDYECGKQRALHNLGQGIPTGPVFFKGKIYVGVSAYDTKKATDTVTGFGKRQGNLIVGNPATGGTLDIESWRELY